MNLPTNEPNTLAQVNSNIPQSIYQPQMAPMAGTINSGIPISSTMHSPHPVVGPPHPQSMMPHQPPPLSNMGPQQLPVGQPMIPGQHQQPMMGGQLPTMSYGAPMHMGQYGTQPIPSQQVNPQPSAPNQLEQPQVAELISFD